MIVVLLFTFVGCILVGWFLPSAFNSKPPYGLAADIIVPTIIGLIWTYIVYAVLAPMFDMGGWLRFAGSIVEGTGVAAVVLWVMRRINR